MYRCAVAADAPTMAAKYDLDHSVGNRVRRRRNSARRAWLVEPLN
jgi:hypothetical protein